MAGLWQLVLRTAAVIIWGFPLPLVFIILVNTTSSPLFYLIIVTHKPISWHLGHPQDGQIILITPPLQTYKAVKAPAQLRSHLSLKARARIMADSQQRPKEMIPKHRQDAKYPLAIRAVGCLFSQTPPFLLSVGAGINLLRYRAGGWRQSSGKGGGVGVDEGEGFFSLCKHPVSPLTSLTDRNQLKPKKPCLNVRWTSSVLTTPLYKLLGADAGQASYSSLASPVSPLAYTGTLPRSLSANGVTWSQPLCLHTWWEHASVTLLSTAAGTGLQKGCLQPLAPIFTWDANEASPKDISYSSLILSKEGTKDKDQPIKTGHLTSKFHFLARDQKDPSDNVYVRKAGPASLSPVSLDIRAEDGSFLFQCQVWI